MYVPPLHPFAISNSITFLSTGHFNRDQSSAGVYTSFHTSAETLGLLEGDANSLALRRTSVRDRLLKNQSSSTNLSVVAELNPSCSASNQSTPGVRYNPDTVGPSPPINLLASTRHVNVFMFKFVDISILYCPQPLGSGRFQSSTLLCSIPSAGVALVVGLPVEAGVAVAGGLLVLDIV